MFSIKIVIGIGLIFSNGFIVARNEQTEDKGKSCWSSTLTILSSSMKQICNYIATAFCLSFCSRSYVSIPDEKINFKITNNKDRFIKYKHILIGFDRIMIERMPDEEITPVEITISEKSIMQMRKSEKLLQIAENLIQQYRIVLSKQDDYARKAYNYRLLQWFKFGMRIDGNTNEKLELTIHELLKSKQQVKETKPNLNAKFLETVSYKWDIETECQKIQTLHELKEFGVQKDQIIDFCLSLGRKNGEVRNEKIKMPFHPKVLLYEKQIYDAYSYPDDFTNFFKINRDTMLRYIYEAVYFRLQIKYERVDVKNINLTDSKKEPLQHLCEVIALFIHIMESLLEQKHIKNITDKDDIVLIENFYHYSQKLQELRSETDDSLNGSFKLTLGSYEITALRQLVKEVVSSYDDQIENFIDTNRHPSKFKAQYGRIIKWFTVNLAHANQFETSLYDKLINIQATERAGNKLEASQKKGFNKSDETYLEITTIENLQNFSKYGRISE